MVAKGVYGSLLFSLYIFSTYRASKMPTNEKAWWCEPYKWTTFFSSYEDWSIIYFILKNDISGLSKLSLTPSVHIYYFSYQIFNQYPLIVNDLQLNIVVADQKLPLGSHAKSQKNVWMLVCVSKTPKHWSMFLHCNGQR